MVPPQKPQVCHHVPHQQSSMLGNVPPSLCLHERCHQVFQTAQKQIQLGSLKIG